jgi:hypothetical protein
MPHLEYTALGDPFYDFCLWEYDPPAPSKNKIRPVNLLFNSFVFAGVDGRALDLVERLRQEIGMFRTVFGIKQIGDRLAWEFYFYDYRRGGRERSMTRVLVALAPFADCTVQPNENLHYFMFSLDIDNDLLVGERTIEEIHMYIGAPGSNVSSAFCYSVTPKKSRLENYYFFFEANQIDDIAKKIAWSAQVDTTVVDINSILLPELKECKVIVIANKQQNDAVYFSRIKIDQLLFFLKMLGYPQPLVGFLEENRARLDHLLYDVGFDYRMEGKDLVVLKSGYYGVF